MLTPWFIELFNSGRRIKIINLLIT
jgi:hypothetical protein